MTTINNSTDSSGENNSSAEAVYVARQPVFDADMQVWGYELLFRQSAQSNKAVIEDDSVATSQVMTDGFNLATEWLDPNQKVLINFPETMLTDGLPRILPANVVVVEILETVEPTPLVLDVCRQLKNEGYTLALDDFVGDPGFEPLLELADMVKVDVLGLDQKRLNCIMSGLKKYPCVLLAEKVEDLALFDQCRNAGFTLFQGYFFSRPQIVAGKKLSTNQISKLKLLQELGAPDLDMERLSGIIKADVSLSYRLLRYINSPGMGLRYAVNSIGQAVNLLGQNKISAWLRVLILADMNPAPHSMELLFFTLQRARFMELLIKSKPMTSVPSDSMFLFGLFSSLDALLSQPMNDIVRRLSLDKRLKQALLGEDPELQTWLDLALASESGYWEQAEIALSKLNIDHQQAASAHNEATVWARSFLEVA